MNAKPFYFKQFVINQDRCAMKIGTDGVLLGAWVEVSNAGTALDVGTGSGVIAIMLAQRSAHLQIHAVEVDDLAFEQAAENMHNSPWADRLTIIPNSIQEYAAECTGKYDLIVSNPPFFTGGTFSQNQDRNSVRHTVKLPHGDLLGAARTLLAPEGRFCVILPYIEGLRFLELAEGYHLHCSHMTEVRTKADKPVERLLMQFERQPRETVVDGLVIQKEDNNDWTEAYMALTRAFYLYM